MKVIATALPGVLVLEPKRFVDERGSFMESYNRRGFLELTGYDGEFVQDNHTVSSRNVLRGLHYQVQQPQGKLIRVVSGAAFDVAVDLRRGSEAFGKWVGIELSAENRRMVWIPPGFAHGFLSMSDVCEVLYKATDYWAPRHERAIRWDDADLGIQWPLSAPPVLSPKDAVAPRFSDAEVYP